MTCGLGSIGTAKTNTYIFAPYQPLFSNFMDEILAIVKYVLGFGICQNKITAVWGSDRCLIEIPGKGAYEVFVRPYIEQLPPDVIVERANERSRDNPTA